MIVSTLFHGPGLPLEFRNSAFPELAPGELLVKIRLCTLCGSDLHTHTGRRTTPTPCVLGHEMVGEVVALGAGTPLTIDCQPVTPGDRVIWSVVHHCGNCFYCQRELPQKCLKLQKYGHLRQDEHRGPLGGLASHMHLFDGTSLVKVPETLHDTVAAPAMCATATVAAAIRAAGDLRGRVVLILGAGLLGITTAAFCADLGAERIIVIDADLNRLTLANTFGATEVHGFPPNESQYQVQHGVDVAFEMSGNPHAVSYAWNATRTGGTVVLVGSVFPSPPIPIAMEDVVRRCLRIVGVHNYAPQDLLSAVAFLSRVHSRLPFAELVEKTYVLSEVEAAFKYATELRPVRVGIIPG